MRKPLISTFLFLAVTLVSHAFDDPAPPTVNQLNPIIPNAAEAQSELTFYQAPKLLSPTAISSDWKTFLGPTHNGYSPETNLLKTFPETGPSKVWEVQRGNGYSSAAVIDQRVIIFHRVNDQAIIECLELETGKRYWKHTYPSTYKDRYGFSNGPRCQPISDGTYVYTLGVEAQLHCLELTTGRVLWNRNLKEEFDLTLDFFGVGGAPLLEGNQLIINVGAPEGPSVVAFDKLSGELIWGAGDQWGPSTPRPFQLTPETAAVFSYLPGAKVAPQPAGSL